MYTQYMCACEGMILYIPSTEVSDYVEVQPFAVTLSPTASRHCLSIVVVDDSVPEDTEYLTVSLSLTEEQSGVLLSQHSSNVHITDDGEKCVYHNYA